MPEIDLSQKALNEQELKTLEPLLYMVADLVNRLLRDGLPYGKVAIQPKEGGG